MASALLSTLPPCQKAAVSGPHGDLLLSNLHVYEGIDLLCDQILIFNLSLSPTYP